MNSFASQKFADDEEIICRGRKHKVIFIWPILLFWMGLFLLIQNISIDNPGNIFIALSFVVALICTRWYRNSQVLLTNKRLFLTRGIFDVKARVVPLHHIEDIELNQNISGYLMRYGDLIFKGDGGKQVDFVTLKKPRAVKHEIERVIAEVRT